MFATFRESLRQAGESGNATRSLQADLNDWRTESQQRREEADKRRRDAARQRDDKLRLWRRIGALAGVVAVILVSAWKTWDVLSPRPEPVQAADVERTVKQSASDLEAEVRENTERITKVEETIEKIDDGIQRIEEKLDAAEEPEPDPQPRARRKKRDPEDP